MSEKLTLEQIELGERLEREATPGEWKVWNGPQYMHGGADLCIGSGDEWLANMDHRYCQNRMHHMGCHDEGCKLEGNADVCSFTDEISKEQLANANLIAFARNNLAQLLSAARREWEREQQLAALTMSDSVKEAFARFTSGHDYPQDYEFFADNNCTRYEADCEILAKAYVAQQQQLAALEAELRDKGNSACAWLNGGVSAAHHDAADRIKQIRGH